MRVLAPAKINLCLRVLCRRRDGYHELDSVFLPLELADELELELLPDAGRVECRCPGHDELAGVENLAARAARLILEASRAPLGVSIRIQKRIWIAAGLGGGSSDAAAVLRALPRALGDPTLSLDAIALELGADVPYFLDPRPARVRGIGERRDALEDLPGWPLVLLNPGAPLSTRAVFDELGLARGAEGPSRSLADHELAALRAAPWRIVGNDLRAPALRLCPAIESLEAALVAEGARAVGLSGSGPTVFGIFETIEAAARAGERLRGRLGERSVLVTMTASS